MGLWDRVMGWLIGDGAEPLPDEPGASGGAVATLEQPPEEPTSESHSHDRWWAPEGETLIEPAPIQRPDLSTEARALENILVSNFDSHNLEMPPLPYAIEKALRRLRDINYDSKLLAADIAEDQVTAAAVLRMANSVMYGGRQKFTALGPAVDRLGANAVRTLMMHQSLRVATFGRQGGDKELTERVWHRSLASGCIMRALAEFSKINPDEALMIGLLHDIGDVIVLREAQRQQEVLNYRIDFSTFEYLCAEIHQELGELVACAWQLPPDLQSLISNHHELPSENDPLRTERLFLQLTDMISAMLGYAPFASYDLLNTRVVESLGLADRGDFVEFLITLPDQVEENVVAVSA